MAKVYSGIDKEIRKEIKSYFEQFSDEDERQKEKLEAGEISKEEYKQWRIRAMCRDKDYEKFRNRLAEKYLKANKEAIQLVEEEKANAVILSHDHTAFLIEKTINKD